MLGRDTSLPVSSLLLHGVHLWPPQSFSNCLWSSFCWELSFQNLLPTQLEISQDTPGISTQAMAIPVFGHFVSEVS